VTSTLEETIGLIEEKEGARPKLMVTSAAKSPANEGQLITYKKAGELIGTKKAPVIIIFGTGWGLVEEVVESADYLLPPISGGNEYNHLSVRSAVSIITDRLFCAVGQE
jgi:hypothetical protein